MTLKKTVPVGDAQIISIDLADAKPGETWRVEVRCTSPDGNILSEVFSYKFISPVTINSLETK